ncbi:hypothetical protein ACFE04_028567 [Oxalis oulophora]
MGHMDADGAPSIISEKNRKEISKYLFKEGVCYAKKDYNLAKHPDIDVPNLQFLRTYLNLPSEIVPATLMKKATAGRPSAGGDRPRGPPRFEGDRPRFGDREGYRSGPRGGGDFGGEKGGAPADYQPSFRGSGGSRPGFGRGGGAGSGAAPSGVKFYSALTCKLYVGFTVLFQLTDGPRFTWKNNRKGEAEVFEKLDRVVSNDRWSAMFPNAVVVNIASSISDHLPIMLNTEKLTGWQRRVKGFEFENFWADNVNCLKIITQSWKEGSVWADNILNVQSELSTWSRVEFGNIPKCIQEKQSEDHGNIIKAIPLCEVDVEDQWCWDGNSKGVYTVSSGYSIAQQILFDGEANTTVSSSICSTDSFGGI